jgi:TetR/AcrR family transcriptional repressor of nem operon
MPRQKEFDQETALRGAIVAFSRKGFSATSTDDLTAKMNIGRQSMYDTFGDKRTLFLRALELYSQENLGAIAAELRKPGSPLAAIRNALMQFTERKDISSTDGCMGINALCEFGLQDQEVLGAMQGQGKAKVLRRLLMATLRRAQAEDEIPSETDITSLANFFDVTLAGLRIAANAGHSRAALRDIVEVACKAFQ